MKNLFSKIIPSNFTNLIGLSKKLVRSKNPAGRAAMFYSFLGLLMIPLDLILQFSEKRLYLKGSKPVLPLIFVCGPPRSGTTLVAQVLIKHLPVYYFNNLTSIFPNAPIISNKIFGRFIRKRNKDVTFKSLYGRTSSMGAPNDALYLWDCWTGVARNRIPQTISPENQVKMQRFFSAVEQFSGKALVNKNNALNTYANLVAGALDTAYFICLDRDPAYLAQSQLIASNFIHGDERIPYGVHFDTINEHMGEQILDPIEQVCNQVLHHKEMLLKQQELIGSKRFVIVPYEDFCADPAKWVCKISDEIMKQPLDVEVLRKSLGKFTISNNVKIDQDTFDKIEILLTNQTTKNDA